MQKTTKMPSCWLSSALFIVLTAPIIVLSAPSLPICLPHSLSVQNASRILWSSSSRRLEVPQCRLKSADDTHSLATGSPEVISLSPGATVTFQVRPFSTLSSFLIMQAYTQHRTLVLTDTTGPVLMNSDKVSGNSVGLVKMLDEVAPWYTWDLKLGDENDVPVSAGAGSGGSGGNVSVSVLVQEYGENVPVPGACNQVFAVEIDPNIRLTTSNHHTQIWFQWANIGYVHGSKFPNCENAGKSRLSYDVYVSYVKENDVGVESLFNVLMSMGTVENVEWSGQKIVTLSNDNNQKSLTTVTSQHAQGAVYSVVVRDKQLGLAATYVSAITYGCNFTSGNCNLDYDAMECGMMVACGIVSLVLLIMGHAFLRTELAVFGFLAFTLVSFTLLMKSDNLTDGMCLGLAATFGVFGGMLSLLLWWKFSFPSLSVLVPGLCAGYLVAGAVFFTPFANITWWGSDLNYGLVFACITLVFAVVLLCSPRTLNIVSCSVVGGFCFAMVPAIAARSSLKLIVLNAIHHSSVPGYATVLVVSPFQATDMILAAVWFVLIMAGMLWQFYLGRGKPHFPNQEHRQRSHLRRGNHSHIQEGILPPSPLPPVADERTPLLGNQTPPPSYEEATTYSTAHGERSPAEMNPIL